MNNVKKPVIFIDHRKKRIRIHRSTLKLLGDPKYIQILVNPERTTLAIRRCKKTDIVALKLPCRKSDSCELYSTNLVSLFYDVCSKWDTQAQYRLIGKMFGDGSIACFRLQESELYNETEAATEDERETADIENRP